MLCIKLTDTVSVGGIFDIWKKISKHDSTWWQNPCWQSQRSDVSCSWPQGKVCTHLRRDFVPLPFTDPLQVIKASRLTFGNSNISSLHRFSMGLRSGDWVGHSRISMFFFLIHFFVALAVCFGSFSCWTGPIHDAFSMHWPWRYIPSSLWCGAVVLSS